MMNTLMKQKWSLLILLVLTIASCGKDDDTTTGTDDVTASFQFEISETNFLEVTFSNFSANATSYSWDFGDGNTSTEEAPTHVYAAAGTYSVELTASDGTTDKKQSKTVALVDPNAQSTILAGSSSKKWYLQREGVALGIGNGINDNSYWSFGGVTPLGDRPCILDDVFTFHADGTVEFESNNTLFIDTEGNGGWLGPTAAEDCYDEDEMDILMSTAGDDLSSFGNGGDYTYEYDPSAGTLKFLGEGFYIGLANKTVAGNSFIPLTEKTYQVFHLVEGTTADTLQVALTDGGDAWNFYLVSYHNDADLPDIPDAGGSTGTDLPNETPTELFNTFASTDAADVQNLVPTESSVVMTAGVDDPGLGATKVGEYIRGTDSFSDLKFQLAYDAQFDNFTTVSVDVYFPSNNDYSGDLSQQVDIFLADASEDTQFWTTWELYIDDTQTTTDQWVTITFNLDNALNRDDIDLIGLKIGGENHNVDGTFYVRNFRFQ